MQGAAAAATSTPNGVGLPVAAAATPGALVLTEQIQQVLRHEMRRLFRYQQASVAAVMQALDVDAADDNSDPNSDSSPRFYNGGGGGGGGPRSSRRRYSKRSLGGHSSFRYSRQASTNQPQTPVNGLNNAGSSRSRRESGQSEDLTEVTEFTTHNHQQQLPQPHELNFDNPAFESQLNLAAPGSNSLPPLARYGPQQLQQPSLSSRQQQLPFPLLSLDRGGGSGGAAAGSWASVFRAMEQPLPPASAINSFDAYDDSVGVWQPQPPQPLAVDPQQVLAHFRSTCLTDPAEGDRGLHDHLRLSHLERFGRDMLHVDRMPGASQQPLPPMPPVPSAAEPPSAEQATGPPSHRETASGTPKKVPAKVDAATTGYQDAAVQHDDNGDAEGSSRLYQGFAITPGLIGALMRQDAEAATAIDMESRSAGTTPRLTNLSLFSPRFVTESTPRVKQQQGQSRQKPALPPGVLGQMRFDDPNVGGGGGSGGSGRQFLSVVSVDEGIWDDLVARDMPPASDLAAAAAAAINSHRAAAAATSPQRTAVDDRQQQQQQQPPAGGDLVTLAKIDRRYRQQQHQQEQHVPRTEEPPPSREARPPLSAESLQRAGRSAAVLEDMEKRLRLIADMSERFDTDYERNKRLLSTIIELQSADQSRIDLIGESGNMEDASPTRQPLANQTNLELHQQRPQPPAANPFAPRKDLARTPPMPDPSDQRMQQQPRVPRLQLDDVLQSHRSAASGGQGPSARSRSLSPADASPQRLPQSSGRRWDPPASSSRQSSPIRQQPSAAAAATAEEEDSEGSSMRRVAQQRKQVGQAQAQPAQRTPEERARLRQWMEQRRRDQLEKYRKEQQVRREAEVKPYRGGGGGGGPSVADWKAADAERQRRREQLRAERQQREEAHLRHLLVQEESRRDASEVRDSHSAIRPRLAQQKSAIQLMEEQLAAEQRRLAAAAASAPRRGGGSGGGGVGISGEFKTYDEYDDYLNRMVELSDMLWEDGGSPRQPPLQQQQQHRVDADSSDDLVPYQPPQPKPLTEVVRMQRPELTRKGPARQPQSQQRLYEQIRRAPVMISKKQAEELKRQALAKQAAGSRPSANGRRDADGRANAGSPSQAESLDDISWSLSEDMVRIVYGDAGPPPQQHRAQPGVEQQQPGSARSDSHSHSSFIDWDEISNLIRGT